MKKATLLILCVALVFALAGCASNTGSVLPTPSPMDTTQPLGSAMPSPAIPMDTSAPGSTVQPANVTPMTQEEATAAAKRISDEVIKLSEIDKATTVVMGNTALVGVTFTTQYKGNLTTRIKDMVSERAKKSAPSIQKVVVTADPDLMSRIQAIMTKITNGSNATDVGSEFTEIVNRIAPV